MRAKKIKAYHMKCYDKRELKFPFFENTEDITELLKQK